MTVSATFKHLLQAALQAAQATGELPAGEIPEIAIEQPQRADLGDYATPIAMALARPMRMAPRAIAQVIIQHLPAHKLVGAVEVAGPGFINLRLSHQWLVGQIGAVLAQGRVPIPSDAGSGKRALVEFVSANPTGPLTVGHGRNLVLGDTLARVLDAAGWEVTREYYFNDGGLQMKNLAESVRLRALQQVGQAIEFPENYYQGAYISEIAKELLTLRGPLVVEEDWTFFRDAAVQAIFADIRRTQERLDIRFDVYTNEMQFLDPGKPGNVWETLERLRAAGATYDVDEATWFRATQYGADKDRVLVRSKTASIYGAFRAAQARLGIPYERSPHEGTAAFYQRDQPDNLWAAVDRLYARGTLVERGSATWLHGLDDEDDLLIWDAGQPAEPTYRLPDMAYHIQKLERGFDLAVGVLGSDHIDQFPDIWAAVRALGHDADRLRVLSYQFVTLMRGGQVVKMSTRQASYVTLDELIDEVGPDAVRFFLLMYSANTPIEFDLELAKRTTDANPVHYVRYSHARTAGIFQVAAEKGIPLDVPADLSLLTHPSERALILEILRLGEVVQGCAATMELHPLTFYARNLGSALSRFYDDCPVLRAESEELRAARLRLVRAAQVALAQVLGLIGVSAPERM